jgi:hypothetical protein
VVNGGLVRRQGAPRNIGEGREMHPSLTKVHLHYQADRFKKDGGEKRRTGWCGKGNQALMYREHLVRHEPARRQRS